MGFLQDILRSVARAYGLAVLLVVVLLVVLTGAGGGAAEPLSGGRPILVLFGHAWYTGLDLYSVAPDGSRLTLIAPTLRRPGPDANGDCREDGTNRILCSSVVFARWSPDRQRVALMRGGGWSFRPGLYVKSARGGRETRLVSREVDGFDWSPDGRRIVYAAAGDLYVTDSRRATLHRIVLSVSNLDPPAWSPDGKQIAYVDTHYNGLWVVDPSGKRRRRLDSNPDGIGKPAWSADSRLIAYTKNYRYVYVISRDGRGRTKINIGADAAGPVSWAPRGRAFALSTELQCGELETCNHEYQIVLKRSPTAAPEWIDEDPSAWHTAHDPRLAWSPDGNQIAFHRSWLDMGERIPGLYIKTLGSPALTKVVDDLDNYDSYDPVDW